MSELDDSTEDAPGYELWPDEDLNAVPECPVCGCTERVPVYRHLEDKVFGVAPGRWDLFRCSRCNSVWLDPRPSPESLGRAYQDYFTHSTTDQPIVRRIGLLRSFFHDALNDYLNARYGLEKEPTLPLGRWLVAVLPPLRAAADTRCRQLPKLPAKGGRLLDIGFGNGGFLKLAEEIGWTAEGIDFDKAAVETAQSRGLSVRHANVADLHAEGEQFDVITLSHVIEHVQEPIQLLQQAFAMLNPGGTLWCETPNLCARGHARFGRYWRDLDPPRHLVLFERNTLIEQLVTVGFAEVKQHWHGLSAFTVYSASNGIQSGQTGTSVRGPWYMLRALGAELMQMISPARREFITVSAIKR
ncbi:MAG: class I SAM-dependent methyltransferase [Pseudomonadota bacterium]